MKKIMYFDKCNQCPNIKHKIPTLYTQVITYIIKTLNNETGIQMSHFYITQSTNTGQLKNRCALQDFLHRDGKTHCTDRTTQNIYRSR